MDLEVHKRLPSRWCKRLRMAWAGSKMLAELFQGAVPAFRIIPCVLFHTVLANVVRVDRNFARFQPRYSESLSLHAPVKGQWVANMIGVLVQVCQNSHPITRGRYESRWRGRYESRWRVPLVLRGELDPVRDSTDMFQVSDRQGLGWMQHVGVAPTIETHFCNRFLLLHYGCHVSRGRLPVLLLFLPSLAILVRFAHETDGLCDVLPQGGLGSGRKAPSSSSSSSCSLRSPSCTSSFRPFSDVSASIPWTGSSPCASSS